MNYYNKSAGQVIDELGSRENGLSPAESEKRLSENGKSKLTEAKKTSNFKRFLIQLSDPMIIILLIAAVLSGITSAYSGESFADVFIIIAVVLINSILGVIQESKAEKAIEALKEMTPHCKSYATEKSRIKRKRMSLAIYILERATPSPRTAVSSNVPPLKSTNRRSPANPFP